MMADDDDTSSRSPGVKPDNLGDLLIRGTVENLLDLEAEMDAGALDLHDLCQWNISPLMVACLMGYKDIVEFLLKNGADPNEKCTEELNTPLHYACLQREYITEGDSSFPVEWQFDHNEDRNSNKEEMIQLLFEHGALPERNTLGFLPIHCAALFAMENIVDYFIAEEAVTDADRLKAIEVLGVSQSVVLDQTSEAYNTFVSALHIRHEIGCEVHSSSPSELEQHLKCRECSTSKDLHKLKDGETEMIFHGLLVGERVLPEKIKQKCLWPNMLYAFYESEKFISLCEYGLKLEMSSRLAVGTVLEGMREFLFNQDQFDIQEMVLTQIASCLNEYQQILMTVGSEHTAARSVVFSSAISFILCDLVRRFKFSRQPFDLLFMPTVSVLKVYSEQTSAYESSESVTQNFFWNVQHLYDRNHRSRKEMRSVIVLLNYVLPILLKYDCARFKESQANLPLLHMTMCLTHQQQDFDVISAIAHKLVRHGCLVETTTYLGRTAKHLALHIAENFETHVHPKLEEILACVSKPSEMLSLQELAARCVLRSRIPYSLGTVPSTVYDFLIGENFSD